MKKVQEMFLRKPIRKSSIIIRFVITFGCVLTFVIGCKKENTNERFSQEELDGMLSAIQEQYLFDKWYFDEENMYYPGNDYSDDIIPIKLNDLEEVIFYQDKENTIYFIPTSMVNKTVVVDSGEIQICEYYKEGKSDYYLYRCTFCKTEWEREIYPPPDNEYVDIFRSMKMWEKLEELSFLGTSRLPLPENMTDEMFRYDLYENEYTDAVVEIIHSYFYDRNMYGNYQIYFGTYSYDQLEYEQHGYKIAITVAIVGEETSYWWVFRAKDTLDEEGMVIIESNGGANHSVPASYEVYNGGYAKGIDIIIRKNRIVLPLTITESDEVRELGNFKDEDDLNTIHYYLK